MTFMDYGVENGSCVACSVPADVSQIGRPARWPSCPGWLEAGPKSRLCCSLLLLIRLPPHLRVRIALQYPACRWIFAPPVPFCNPPPISCLSSYFDAGCDLFLSMCHIMITTTTTIHSTLHDSFSCFLNIS